MRVVERLTPEGESRRLTESLSQKVADLTLALEKSSLAEYVELVRRPWWMIWINFLAGMARGLGMAVGFTLLGALLIYVLKGSFVQGLPIIGGFLADLVEIVQIELRSR